MNNQYRAARKLTYFQFPLCAFAFGSNEKERLDAIISYGLVQAGEKWWRRATEEQRRERLLYWSKSKPIADFYSNQNRHLYAKRGAEITKVTISSIRGCLEQCDGLQSFCDGFIARHGGDPLVRLKTSFVFEARDGKGISARELPILAAIYSIIGNKQGPVLITQDRIRRRALGYKSAAVMQVELPKRKDAARPLTDWQLRSLLEKLTARKFFARSTYGRRLTYYSHRMTQSALRKAIVDRKTFMFENKFIRRQDDQAMTEAIQNHRAALAGRRPIFPDAQPLRVRGFPNIEDLGNLF